MDSRVSTQPKNQQKKMGSEEKNAAVHEEMKRMKRLPVNSTYATHRLRVLNKILQLISIQNVRSWILYAWKKNVYFTEGGEYLAH